jgi:hypothetical protein
MEEELSAKLDHIESYLEFISRSRGKRHYDELPVPKQSRMRMQDLQHLLAERSLLSTADVQELFDDTDALLSDCRDPRLPITKRGKLDQQQWLPLSPLTDRRPCVQQEGDNSCGFASLQVVLQLLGKECSLGCYRVHPDGMSGEQIIQEASRCGVPLTLLWDSSGGSSTSTMTLHERGVFAYLMHGSNVETGEGFAVPLCGTGYKDFDRDRVWPSAQQVMSAIQNWSAFVLLYRHKGVYADGHFIVIYRDEVGRWCLCNSHHNTPFLFPHPSYVALLLRGAEVLIVA